MDIVILVGTAPLSGRSLFSPRRKKILTVGLSPDLGDICVLALFVRKLEGGLNLISPSPAARTPPKREVSGHLQGFEM